MNTSGQTAIFIPVRIESTRLPGKPLADIHGLPMVVHVVRRSVLSGVGPVFVATDSERIAEVLSGERATVVMTSADHRTGSDRIGEAVRGIHAPYVINVQGDEALVRPEDIRTMDRFLRSREDVECALLMAPMDRLTSSDIKLAVDVNGRILFMTRADIPFDRFGVGLRRLKAYHVVGFRRSALDRFVSLPQTPMELTESVEYLRILEHGHSMHAVAVPACAKSVDTPADLEEVRGAFNDDDVFPLYR